MSEIDKIIPDTVLHEVEDKAKVYRALAIDIDLSGLPDVMRSRVRTLLRLGHLLADEIDSRKEESPLDMLNSYTDNYKQIADQINENQKQFERASQYLVEYSQKRVQSLVSG